MELERHKSNSNETDRLQPHELADEIYLKLHQGSLFEIHQLLLAMKEEEKKCLVGVFMGKFNFDFSNYI